MKSLITSAILIFSFHLAFIQSFEWVSHYKTLNPGSGGARVQASDGDGNIYLTAETRDSLHLNQASSAHYVTKSSFSDYSAVILKTNSSGEYLDHFELSGSGSIRIGQVIFDSQGDMLILGTFVGSIDMDPFGGSAMINSIASSRDVVIAKYSGFGNLVWAKTYGGSSPAGDRVADIELDSADNIYLVGEFIGTVDFDPGIGVANETYQSGIDLYLLKFNSSGVFQWVSTLNGFSMIRPFEMEIVAGELHVLAMVTEFTQEIDFDPGAGQYVVNMKEEDYLSFIWRTNLNSSFLGVTLMHPSANHMSIASNGDYIIAGGISYQDTVDMDPDTNSVVSVLGDSNQNSYLLSLSASSAFNWVQTWQSSSGILYRVMELDQYDQIYLGGQISGTIDLDPSSGSNIVTSQGNWIDAVVCKIGLNGNYLWSDHFGGEQIENVSGLLPLSTGELIATGSMQGTTDFNSGPDSAIVVADSGAAFMMKYTFPLGIESRTSADFFIYPNPSNDLLNIETNGQNLTRVSLFDLSGREVLKNSIIGAKTRIQVDVSGLASGAYLLMLDNEFSKKKVIVYH